jgi:hypothetical protein
VKRTSDGSEILSAITDTVPELTKSIAEEKDRLAIAAGYINHFHREQSEQLKAHLTRQPRATLEEAMAQYDRIKRGSRRKKP